MILVIDVGNTNTVIGIFQQDTLVAHWRLATNPMLSQDELGLNLFTLMEIKKIPIDSIDASVISSVVPTITQTFQGMIRNYFHLEPIVIGPGVKTGINIKYDNPKEVGSDRIVNAIAAYRIYGGPCIVVDFGTATTFDALNEQGHYLGGCICPGLKISSEALFARASKLPKVDLVKPAKIIGKNTEQSMQAGIVYGYIGQVDYIVRRMKKELGGKATVVATGDYAALICNDVPSVDHINPDLTFIGLKLLYELNQKETNQ